MDVADISRDAYLPGKGLPSYVKGSDSNDMEEAHRQGALHMALLQNPLALLGKYYVEGTETEGHKAARRNEQLLQLFLYLHVLAAETPGGPVT